MKKSLIILAAAVFLTAGSSFAAVSQPAGPNAQPKTGAYSQSPSDKYLKPNYQKTYSKPVTTPKTYSNSTKTPNSNSTSLNGNSKKVQLDAIAMSILRDAESRKNGGVVNQSKMKRMMDLGVTEMCSPQIIAKRTPNCPPIKIKVNNRNLSGSKCAQMCYVLDGKQYDVGYCK